MDIITRTTNLAKILYPYFDYIRLLVDKNLSVLEINHSTSENKQINSKINKLNKTITSNGKQLNFYSDTLFSPYSLIYFMRTKNIKLYDNYNYKVFDGKKLKEVLLKVSKIENIKVPYGTFECLNVAPIDSDKLIKNKGLLEIWYTNDEEKIPIQIKLDAKIGTFTMKLNRIIENE